MVKATPHEAAEVLGSETVIVEPATGGTLQLGDATLTVPAGAISESTTFTPYELSVPASDLPPEDGALGGFRPLSDTSFAFTVDPTVTLFAPLSLEVPFDASRLPDGVEADGIEAGHVWGNYLLPRGLPPKSQATRSASSTTSRRCPQDGGQRSNPNTSASRSVRLVRSGQPADASRAEKQIPTSILDPLPEVKQ